MLARLTSTPDVEDAQRQWTGRTRFLEVAKWPRGYSGELISHRRLLHSQPTDLSDFRRWCAASGLLRVCCVSLDGALHLCDVCYVSHRGLQAVWLFDMFERTPILFQWLFFSYLTLPRPLGQLEIRVRGVLVAAALLPAPSRVRMPSVLNWPRCKLWGY